MDLWYVSDTLQLGHWGTKPQFLHETKLENPLLFKNNIDWWPLSKFEAISSISLRLKILILPSAISLRISTMVVFGSGALLTRSGILRSAYFPLCARNLLSISGVALARSTTEPCCLALNFAISIASYLGVNSDLYVFSCSSSTIISPIFLNGAKTALRAPTTIST